MLRDNRGKTFLYGGYTSNEYLPFYKQARSFSDIWQLKVDVMNGFFEDVDVEEEARSAKAGPWQRCFTCGSTGHSWKRCGGKPSFCVAQDDVSMFYCRFLQWQSLVLWQRMPGRRLEGTQKGTQVQEKV